MKRNNKRGRRSGRKSKEKRSGKKDVIRAFILIFTVIAVFIIGRDVYYFATESKTDPNDMYPVKGVDVSAYQKDIDWKGLEDEGIRFAFIKATEGSSHVDENFEYNWREANKTEMRVGAYHFMSYDTSGKMQADNFIKNVDKKWGMLPPAVDVEFYGAYTKDHPDPEKMYSILDVILKELEDRYKEKPIIYTNTYIYDNYISGRYDDYPIWISDHSIPQTLSDGRKWSFCQYTFRAVSKNVAGGEKYVDMNVFNGSRWEFRNYDTK